METLKEELKAKIIDSLKLEEITPEEIGDDAPLFGEGLGLDSIDALELVVMLEKEYGIVLEDRKTGEAAFRSVSVLAEFVASRRN